MANEQSHPGRCFSGRWSCLTGQERSHDTSESAVHFLAKRLVGLSGPRLYNSSGGFILLYVVPALLEVAREEEVGIRCF